MTAFLKQIAQQYFADKENMSRTVFVFPSRRAVVFFRKYLSSVVLESGSGPVLIPTSLTMDEFVLALSDLRKADRVTLVLELYKCYCNAFENSAGSGDRSLKPDSLDDFVFWADMILADFNDIDKYYVDAKDLLRNIAQYRQIKDDFSYLSETQRMAMQKFLGHFGKMGEKESVGRYKQRFADIWDLLYPIYTSFNKVLSGNGQTYEGAVYRHVADKVAAEGGTAVFSSAFPGCIRVVFCGLNALNECEKKVMDSLKRLSLAQFCWDYASSMIKDEENRSSFFMRDNIERYGNDLALEPCDTVPEIEVISVSSAIGQAKLLDVIMKENPSVKGDDTTAVMLADETLLLPMLSSIPDSVSTVNVTMGYPLSSSSFYSLLDDICQMVLRTRKKDGGTQIYHKLAWNITGNNIFEALSDDETRRKVADMKRERRYFIDSETLSGTALLDTVFKCPGMDVEAIRIWLLSIMDFMGRSIAASEKLKADMALEMDFAMECSKTLNLLAEAKLDLTPAVWLHVFLGLLSGTSIPFSGEPLCGLQIMGPLETRALDFDNLIVMSVNENVFPRKSVASSFIPPLLRRDFGLPTYEYQDAVWAYYFYRMIQRPSKVWLVLDSRSDGLNSGEESRYVKQLRYHFKLPLVQRYANASPEKRGEETVIAKTPEIIEKLHARALSASAIQNYRDCPLKFYYSFIERLRNEDEVSETLDGGMIGNVFHNTMEDLFNEVEGGKITLAVLENMRADKTRIMERVRHHIREELKCDTLRGREVIFSRIICGYVAKVLSWDIDLLKNSCHTHFISNTEHVLYSKLGNFDLTGRIDRMDLFPDGKLRIVDYKTGKANSDKFAIQLYIYSHLVNNPANASKVPSFKSLDTCIFSTRSASDNLPESFNADPEAVDAVADEIRTYLEELDDRNIPFRACEDGVACKYCDFIKICHKCSR